VDPEDPDPDSDPEHCFLDKLKEIRTEKDKSSVKLKLIYSVIWIFVCDLKQSEN
jgi:hypothetical protein